jgi:hypothetical protein
MKILLVKCPVPHFPNGDPSGYRKTAKHFFSLGHQCTAIEQQNMDSIYFVYFIYHIAQGLSSLFQQKQHW